MLVRGRSLRRRRRVTTASPQSRRWPWSVAAWRVALNVAGQDRAQDIQPAQTPDLGAVFSVGTTVYLDSGERSATIDDRSIKSMYYTSVGILVRHGNNPYSDGGGPQRFSLVRPDGTVSPVDVETEETVHSTDPDQPYLAYAEVVDDTVNVVVWNVDTDQEQARVPVPGNVLVGRMAGPAGGAQRRHVFVGSEDVARAVELAHRRGHRDRATSRPATRTCPAGAPSPRTGTA